MFPLFRFLPPHARSSTIGLGFLLATLLVAALSLACEDQGHATATVGPGTLPAAATPPEVSATAAPPTATIDPPTAVPPTQAPAVVATEPPALQPTQPPAPQPTQPPAPQPTEPPAPSGPVTMTVSAINLLFDRTSISVPRNTSITVNFRNDDTAVDHDFGVSIAFVPHTPTCAGPCQASITFNSGPPARHTFQCTLHPEMVGTFIVQ